MTILPGKPKPILSEAWHRPVRRERWNVDDYLSTGRLQNFACTGLFIEMMVRSYIIWLPWLVLSLHDETFHMLALSRSTSTPQDAVPAKDVSFLPKADFVLYAGFAIGLVVWNSLPLDWGRRQLVLASVLLFSVAHWLQALVESSLFLIALRLLVGFGMGQVTLIWLIELVRSNRHVSVISLAVAGWALGGFLAVAVAGIFADISPTLISVVPTMPIVLSLLIYAILCRESPQVMVLHWSHEKATQEMLWIARVNKTMAEHRTMPEVIFNRRRSYGSIWGELGKSALYTIATFLTFAIIGALFYASHVKVALMMRRAPLLYAIAISGLWLSASVTLLWWATFMGRKPIIIVSLLLSGLSAALYYFQPLLPLPLALAQLLFVMVAGITVSLTTIEWYPATSRALGFAFGAIAALSGAAGFWYFIGDPDLQFVTSMVLTAACFFISLCRAETAGLVPRLRVSDISEDAGIEEEEEEESRYLLPND